MKQCYLVVFEKTEDGWSAFAPDVPGTGGVGDTVDQARESLREGIGYMLEYAIQDATPIPEPRTMSVDFSEFDPEPSKSHYEIEWLAVEVPEASPLRQDAQQAA
jgi:predicted RNase H-like HicB family nuclease